MNKFIAAILVGILVLPASVASAQSNHGGQYSRDNRDHSRDNRNSARSYNFDNRSRQADHNDHRGVGGPQSRAPGYYGQQFGYGSQSGWRVGQRYPNYNQSRYVLNDYRGYGLSPPRSGYRYYRDNNGDIVMAAIASGIIGLIIGGASNNNDGYSGAYQGGYTNGYQGGYPGAYNSGYPGGYGY